MPSSRRLPMFALAACLGLLAGCDIARSWFDSQEHAPPIATEIEAAIGVKPDVFAAGRPPVLVVTVSFSTVPDAAVATIEKAARAAVQREFKGEPSTLMIQFVYQATP